MTASVGLSTIYIHATMKASGLSMPLLLFHRYCRFVPFSAGSPRFPVRSSPVPHIEDVLAATLSAVPRQLFIAGQWRGAAGGATLDVEDPATGKTLGQVADASPADGMAALDAAVAAQDDWAATAPRARSEILR